MGNSFINYYQEPTNQLIKETIKEITREIIKEIIKEIIQEIIFLEITINKMKIKIMELLTILRQIQEIIKQIIK